jgi:hypothetical protein
MDCEFWTNLCSIVSTSDDPFTLDNARMHLGDIDSAYVARLLKPLHRGRILEAVRDSLLNLSPVWRRSIADWKVRNRRIVDAVGEVSGSKVIVDSSKIGIRIKYLLKTPGIKLKVLRLVRDGRAVALTYMNAFQFADARDPRLRGGGTGENRHVDLPMAAAAREWLRSNEEALAILGNLDPNQYLQVRYEDLCADVDGTLGRIYEFLELPPDQAFRRFKEVEHHVVGNGMRLDGSSEVVLDERWKGVLTTEDLATFDSVAGDMNRYLGYS